MSEAQALNPQVVVFGGLQEKETTSFRRTYAPIDENLEKVIYRGQSSIMGWRWRCRSYYAYRYLNEICKNREFI